MVNFCYTVQAILKAQVNPESNLIYSIEDHEISTVGKPESTRRTGFDVRTLEDMELAGAMY